MNGGEGDIDSQGEKVSRRLTERNKLKEGKGTETEGRRKRGGVREIERDRLS